MNTLKRYQIWIALAVLILPILARGLWFYQGLPHQPKVQTPDYASFAVPQLPLSTAEPAAPEMSPGKVIVLDYTHSNQFDPSEIKAFVSALTSRGARIEIDDGSLALSTRLKYADAYVVISPNYTFTAGEVAQVQRFVQCGGRLLVLTDPTRGTLNVDYFTGATIAMPDVNAANILLAPFDIAFTNDYLYDLVKNEGNFRNVMLGEFGENDLTTGLTQVIFYGAHSVTTNTGTPLILGDKDTLSSRTDLGGPSAGSGLAAAALSADGNILAIGDFTFTMLPYNQVADNNVLITNIGNFLFSGGRAHNLTDFPYLFGRSVYLLPTGDVQLTADLLGPVARLQATLLQANTTLTINNEPPAEGDRLVLGTLTPGDELNPIIEPFGLGLDNTDSITIPDFGEVGRSGIAVILFKPGDPSKELRQAQPDSPGQASNTLILLTDMPEDLPTFVDLLASGDLSTCVIQGNIGVCKIGYGGSFYSGSGARGETKPPEVTPTPTPAG